MTNINSNLDIILNFIKKGTGAKQAEQAVDKLRKTTEGAEQTSKKFNIAQTAMALGLGAITLKAIKQIPQMANLGFKYKNAKIALEAYVGSAEVATEITDAITEAAGFAVDKFTAVSNATRLISLGLATTADEAAEFTKIAVTLGATMGKDVQGSFEEFSLLLANESILRLDTYGISGAKVREEMARLSAEFPEMDRNARFTNATLTIGREKLEKLEAAGFEAVSSIDRLGATFENLKIGVAEFVADGVLPATDGFTGMGSAAEEANKRLAEGTDTFEEYDKAARLANTSLGADVIGRLALSAANLSREEHALVKATQALEEANKDLVVVEEEVILTQGGINELLQEETFLAKALSLGIGGSLTKAYDKWEEGVIKVGGKLEDLRSTGRDLNQELRLSKQASIDLTEEWNRGTSAGLEYQVATNSLIIKQKELDKRFKDGKISAEKYRNETSKLKLSQIELDETIGDTQGAFQEYNETMGELQQEQTDIQAQLNELGITYEKTKEETDKLTESLKRATAELIFQSAAAELDANTSLLLARQLGLVDEATFAVAQEAQRLRIQFDEGAISAEEFAGQAGDLADNVGALQSKSIDVNVNTIQAERNIQEVQRRLDSVKLTALSLSITELAGIRGAGPGFADGGQFTIPDTGPMGDIHPVAFNAQRGETVTISPRDGSAPAGGGDVNIGTVNLGNAVDLAFFLEGLRR